MDDTWTKPNGGFQGFRRSVSDQTFAVCYPVPVSIEESSPTAHMDRVRTKNMRAVRIME
jgi:hypothetical protein